MKKILVPMGGSEYSRAALQYAIGLAKKTQSCVQGLYVKDIRFLEGPWFNVISDALMQAPYFQVENGQVNDALQARAVAVEKYFTSTCHYEQVDFVFETRQGVVHDIIATAAKSVDLTVMGKRGEHAAWMPHQIGSTCAQVIGRIEHPLLVVDIGRQMPVRHILVCYGGGAFAIKGLEMAADFAKVWGARLTVLTIAGGRKRALGVREEAAQFLQERGIETAFLLSAGSVEREIVRVSYQENPDIVVLGASIVKTRYATLFPSLAGKLLEQTETSLLVVR